MRKRDLIEEILDRRSRLMSDRGRWGQLLPRLTALTEMGQLPQRLSEEDAFVKSEVARYLALGYVACVEGFCRLAIRDLVDQHPTFRANLLGFEFKVSIEHLVAIGAGRMTLGEFISHLLPLSSLEDINNSMSKIIGDDLLNRIKVTRLRLFETECSLQDLGLEAEVFAGVKELFRLRHIFAHELTVFEVDFNRVKDHGRWCGIFLAMMSRLVTDLLGEQNQTEADDQPDDQVSNIERRLLE